MCEADISPQWGGYLPWVIIAVEEEAGGQDLPVALRIVISDPRGGLLGRVRGEVKMGEGGSPSTLRGCE